MRAKQTEVFRVESAQQRVLIGGFPAGDTMASGITSSAQAVPRISGRYHLLAKLVQAGSKLPRITHCRVWVRNGVAGWTCEP